MPDMSNNEAIDMMNRCVNEIAMLRVTIDRLRPKADAYDNMAAILRLLPQPSQGMGEDFQWEDLQWVLKKRIQELTPKPESAPVPAI